MRDKGLISAFGAGINAEEDGEDPVIKNKWNVWYVD
jgi:hypothetical protein